jgi:nucleotide-binding universal stress UspA family protein
MFTTIVLGLDGSDGAKRAIPFAVELARRDDAKLVIAHVEEDIVGKGGGPIAATEDEIQAQIERQAEELSSQGVPTTVRKSTIMLGGPAAAIARIADDADADLMVVGTHGHSAIAGVILGSVAQRLPYMAHQPVLVVPAEAHLRTGEGSNGAKADTASAAR